MNHPWTNVTTIAWALTDIFLVSLILLQRGRGGGLAGAFGATGGQSAFGTKAGDVFTRITIGTAFAWIALAALSGVAMRAETVGRFQ
jgi:preprotein translocase subunit SecG